MYWKNVYCAEIEDYCKGKECVQIKDGICKINSYVLIETTNLKWFWMGKSPKVRKAVEEYLLQIFNLNLKKEWKKQPYNDKPKWKRQIDIAKKHNVSLASVGIHFREIINNKELRREYGFDESWDKLVVQNNG
jgi:hypothetical protein